jgi:two-component system sensor histidine kinase TctE
MFQNRALRAAVLERQQPLPYTVVVAQTTNSQDLLFQRLMFISLVPQAFLLIWLALWLRRVIQEDVQPLMDLEEAVARRDAYDLTPVAVSNRTRDVQRLTEVVNDLFLRVGQSVRTQREFVGNVAHELRTPLAGVRALVEYALSQSDPKVWQEQLRNIAQSQERASHLIDQLLALALAEEAEQALQPQQIALDEVVRDTLMRHLHRADTLGVDLGARGLEAPVWVLAQRALLEGVLDNLIDNALRYGLRDASQARHVTLEVAHDPRTERVVLSVQDNGPGITEEQRKRVLSRWGQGSAGEALKQGSGLGLAIVSEYARILGATLTLEAGDDGRGLKVSLTFADQFSVG